MRTFGWVLVPGRAGKFRSLTLVLKRQQSTVPVEALHHHAELQAHRHYRAIGVEPERAHPLCRTALMVASGALSTTRGDRVATIFARPGEPGSGLYPAELHI
jgi:hypothetical protein